MDSANLAADSTDNWCYSAKPRTDSANIATDSADSPDISAKPFLLPFLISLDPYFLSFYNWVSADGFRRLLELFRQSENGFRQHRHRFRRFP